MEKIMLKFYQVYNNNLSFKSMKFEIAAWILKLISCGIYHYFHRKKEWTQGTFKLKSDLMNLHIRHGARTMKLFGI